MAVALSAQAGTIEITATGTASMAPEYVVTTAQVISRCYGRAREAADANAALAKEIEAVFKPYMSSDLSEPYTQIGGEFNRQREAMYVGQKEVEYCPMGWRTYKTLTLKLKDISKLPDLQDAVLNIVDRKAGAATTSGPQSWIQWNSPQPAICDESSRKLEEKALASAILNARRELSVLASKCDMHNAKLTGVGLNVIRNYPKAQGYADRALSAPGASIEAGSGSSFSFGSISQSVTRVFTYEFDGGAESCKVPSH
jgi:uncharacterized protein YggE